MLKKLSAYTILLILAARTLVYAHNPQACPVEVISKVYRKSNNPTCSAKFAKSPSALTVSKTKAKALSQPPSPANTFENFVAPFIRTMAPLFYDQIISKEHKSRN